MPSATPDAWMDGGGHPNRRVEVPHGPGGDGLNTALAMDCVDHLWVPVLLADKIERCMLCTTVRVWQLVGGGIDWVYYPHSSRAA